MKIRNDLTVLFVIILVLSVMNCRTFNEASFIKDPVHFQSVPSLKVILSERVSGGVGYEENLQGYQDEKAQMIRHAFTNPAYDRVLDARFPEGGAAKGVLVILPRKRDININGVWAISMYVAFLGPPFATSTCTIDLHAELYSAQGLSLIKSYDVTGSDWAAIAMYWGYAAFGASGGDVLSASCAGAVAKASDNLVTLLNNDAVELKQRLP